MHTFHRTTRPRAIPASLLLDALIYIYQRRYCQSDKLRALETLVDQAGVCRDFAHLMIALCRALNMPARFVPGIDYGADPSLGPTDFHAYVEVILSGRWYLFDPSGVAPPMGLIRLGTGRDAADIPFVTVFGNVCSESPCVIIDAITDPAAGLQLPVYQHFAISSAGHNASAYTSF
jgi:transglutaminase-like putative cysteine protease